MYDCVVYAMYSPILGFFFLLLFLLKKKEKSKLPMLERKV